MLSLAIRTPAFLRERERERERVSLSLGERRSGIYLRFYRLGFDAEGVYGGRLSGRPGHLEVWLYYKRGNLYFFRVVISNNDFYMS